MNCRHVLKKEDGSCYLVCTLQYYYYVTRRIINKWIKTALKNCRIQISKVHILGWPTILNYSNIIPIRIWWSAVLTYIKLNQAVCFEFFNSQTFLLNSIKLFQIFNIPPTKSLHVLHFFLNFGLHFHGSFKCNLF